MRKTVYIILAIILTLCLAVFIFLQRDIFGARPSGKRLELMKQSRNFRDGQFQNLSVTPSLAEGYSYIGVFYNFFFLKKEHLHPDEDIPSVKTNLKSLPKDADVLVWFGHSSYFLQIDGKRILVDPVLSGYASPVEGMNKAFRGSDVYKVEDLPQIDYLLITHDHYDHLDYETVLKLKGRVEKVVCPLGVGAHFEQWGYPASMLIEKDWGDKVMLNDQLNIYFTPARHFSGRSLFRNNTLWSSYVLETPSKRIFVGGDSGYDTHFADIGKKFGSFDLAILENGQYNEAWRYIHTMPQEVLQAGNDLRAKRILPVHSGKFDLGGHAWYEPLEKLTELNKVAGQPLVTPIIGEVVDLDSSDQQFSTWWRELMER